MIIEAKEMKGDKLTKQSHGWINYSHFRAIANIKFGCKLGKPSYGFLKGANGQSYRGTK